MKDKVWTVNFKGHEIKAVNKLSLLPPRTSELLEVDGVVIRHVRGHFLRMTSSIIEEITLSGIEHTVEVRIAQRADSLTTGCQIFVDGEFLGGDAEIQFPDLSTARQQLADGYISYFMKVGLIRYGLPFAFLMLILARPETVAEAAWTFVFHQVFFGGVMSYWSWRGVKTIVSERNVE